MSPPMGVGGVPGMVGTPPMGPPQPRPMNGQPQGRGLGLMKNGRLPMGGSPMMPGGRGPGANNPFQMPMPQNMNPYARRK